MLDVAAIREKNQTSRLAKVTPEELRAVPVERLAEPEFYQRLLETSVDPQYSYEIGKTAQLLAALKEALERGKALADRDGERWLAFQELVVYLQWNCLPLVSPADAERLFQLHLLFCRPAEIEVVEKVLRLYVDYVERPAEYQRFRAVILRGLKANQERLGSRSMTVNRAVVPPYVGNWLADYDHGSTGAGARRDLARITYLNQSQNVKGLRAEERETLRQVLKSYDFFKFPVLASGRVAATGHVVPEEAQRPLSESAAGAAVPPVPDVMQQRIQLAYQGEIAQERMVAREADGLKRAVGSDPGKLSAAFFAAVQEKNVARTIAALRLLCERGGLERMLADDRRLQRYLLTVWPARYGAAAAAQFAEAPTARQSVQMFIQYVLQERLGLPEGEAARAGVKLGNIFTQRGRHEYEKLAYFDVKSKTFKWLT